MVGVERSCLACPSTTSGSMSRITSVNLGDRLAVHLERIVAAIEEDDVGTENVRGGLRLGPPDGLTFSSVWPSSFHSLPDSPRSPNDNETTIAVPPFPVTVAIAPAARHTKSAECALTTRNLRDCGDLAIARLYKRQDTARTR